MDEAGPELFPKWVNRVRTLLAVGVPLGVLYVAGIMTYGFSPYATDVGYMPDQPLPYSHRVHAGKLGIDCRYCHNTVEYTAQASLPPTETCYGCHAHILPDSPKLERVRQSYATGTPIPWVKVHDLPDYAYFNHSAHVRRGVGCVTCHGRVDKMDVVYQVQPLSMSWCLECHRNPDKYLRPPDQVTNMEWTPPGDAALYGRELRQRYNIRPSTDCSTCHR